jgi:hypothetical protein
MGVGMGVTLFLYVDVRAVPADQIAEGVKHRGLWVGWVGEMGGEVGT